MHRPAMHTGSRLSLKHPHKMATSFWRDKQDIDNDSNLFEAWEPLIAVCIQYIWESNAYQSCDLYTQCLEEL